MSPVRTRRTQIILLVAGLVLCYILFFSSEADPGTDFRGKTEAALKRKHSILAGDISDEDLLAQTNEKLQQILGDKQIPDGTKQDEIPVAGRKTMPNPRQSPFHQAAPKERPKYPKGDEEAEETPKPEKVSDPGEEMAREQLQQILKKSPIIIFSKSYCPHSKRAKQLLLHMYDIKPAPYVVELDEMTELVPKPKGAAADGEGDGDDHEVTLGRKLQDLLASLTGRRTVPNIMINTKSIGGASEVVEMDQQGTLLAKIKEMGGKRIVSAKRLEEEG
jgi:glutaredoxin